MDRLPEASGDRQPARALPVFAAEERFLDLVRLIPAIVWEADGEDYRMTFVSERCRDLLGYEPEEWLTEPGFWEAHLHPDDRLAAIAAADAAIEGVNDTRLEYRFQAADGSYRWFHDAVQVVRDRSGVRRLVGVMLDITKQKALEARLAHAASHDSLTGLRNRAELLVTASALLTDAAALPVGVLFIDLDGFKALNDRRGHQAGDAVLRVVAARLSGAVRDEDIVGRIGGDEFVVVVPRATMGGIRALAARTRRSVLGAFSLGDARLVITASIGTAISSPGDSVDDLMDRADRAMYRAKRRGAPAPRPTRRAPGASPG